ncbi:YitT family protein [Cohaesibacter celericrescens]|uniref:YitT family protein n=1 Tax=Cohaesibacter celericrescens TaxID=2067669 RepID=A0A2N5XKQ6_9HYPH|nr:YitT family protein [Cohaesibacter celericrescens]PLW75103.1 YitT family protein [Cohaesibacter celericrescens]
MSISTDTKTTIEKHSLFDDLQGLAYGIFSCAIGLVFLTHLGFLTGQTAGLALLIAYTTGYKFGVVFFLVNIPFYWFTYKRLGLRFTVKSAICVAAMSVLVEIIPATIVFESLNPLVGTLAFGALTGSGLLAIIRHEGSLGGAGAMALTIQESTGFRAGYVQQIFDLVLFATALFFFPLEVVTWSIFGSLILNGIIALNHRRDRYIAR